MCLKTLPYSLAIAYLYPKSCVWFLDGNRNRRATFSWSICACREREKRCPCYVGWGFFFKFSVCFHLVFNLSSSAQDKKCIQIQRYHWTYQNHLSSLTLKIRQKILQNKISSPSGPCSCQECPMTALWEATAFQIIRKPWSLLIKESNFPYKVKRYPSCTHKRIWLQTWVKVWGGALIFIVQKLLLSLNFHIILQSTTEPPVRIYPATAFLEQL